MLLKYYSIFNEFSSEKIVWNFLRNSPKELPYFVPFNKNEYINSLDKLDYSKEYEYLKKYILENNIQQLISIGVGKASIEYQIKKIYK